MLRVLAAAVRVTTVAAVATVAVVAVVLAGCAAELGPGPAGPATALTLPARASSDADDDEHSEETDPTRAAPPANGADVASCADGDCEVRVPDGTEIRLDPRFDVEAVHVTVADGRARIRIDTDGGGFATLGGDSGSSTYNGLTVQLLGVEGDTALVRIRTR